MKNNSGVKRKQDTVYHEESAKWPVLILGVVLVLAITPWVWTLSKINYAGSKSADISKYTALIQFASADIDAVKYALASRSTKQAIQKRSVTLIVPELVVIDEVKLGTLSPLQIKMNGIYWNPSNPLVGINSETYGVGDKVQGYVIVKIGKTAVHFKAKDGTIVVKDFYENLF